MKHGLVKYVIVLGAESTEIAGGRFNLRTPPDNKSREPPFVAPIRQIRRVVGFECGKL